MQLTNDAQLDAGSEEKDELQNLQVVLSWQYSDQLSSYYRSNTTDERFRVFRTLPKTDHANIPMQFLCWKRHHDTVRMRFPIKSSQTHARSKESDSPKKILSFENSSQKCPAAISWLEGEIGHYNDESYHSTTMCPFLKLKVARNIS